MTFTRAVLRSLYFILGVTSVMVVSFDLGIKEAGQEPGFTPAGRMFLLCAGILLLLPGRSEGNR
jgi:hypothetical protein